MLTPATATQILPLLRARAMPRSVFRLYCLQAERSQCFAFEYEGQVVGFGGFYPEAKYLECWFMACDELARPVVMRRLIRALRNELMLRSILDNELLVSNVRLDNVSGQKIAHLLGFVPGPNHPDNEAIQQWVFPILIDE